MGAERVVRREILAAFADSIFAKARVLRAINLEKREQQRLVESISGDIRKFSDLVSPGVSVAAQRVAQQLGIDLREMGWQDQPRFDAGRRTFHWEHMQPVREVRALCLRSPSAVDVAAHLEKARVVWMLKEENRRLTQLGLRVRQAGPGKCL